MRYIKEDMKGHIRMWAEIAKKHGSPTCEHPYSHEVFQYMGSTQTEHQFRHRDLMVDGVEKGHYTESIPIEDGDFDYLSPYEYTTRLLPNGVAIFSSSDTDLEKQGWVRIFGEHTGEGSFLVYHRMRRNTSPEGVVM